MVATAFTKRVLKFAYNEVSFFLIRLLQRFSSIELDPTSQPPESRPPAEWAKAKGYRKRVEKIFPKLHLTMYSMASDGMVSPLVQSDLIING